MSAGVIVVEEVEVVVPVDKAIAVVEEVLVHEMPCIVIRRLLILMCIVRTLSRMSCKGHLCCVFFIFLNFILFKILKCFTDSCANSKAPLLSVPLHSIV